VAEEIPNPKSQIPNNIELPKFKTAIWRCFGHLAIGISGLFGIWRLGFGILKCQYEVIGTH
jgi:hypothetical protein